MHAGITWLGLMAVLLKDLLVAAGKDLSLRSRELMPIRADNGERDKPIIQLGIRQLHIFAPPS